MAAASSSHRYLERPAPAGLVDVVDLILDKGLVIDIYVRVSLIGIEILTIDARIVVASVDTYLRFAEAVDRMNIDADDKEGLPELMQDITSGASKSKAKGALDAAKEKFDETFASDEEEEEEEPEKEPAPRPRRKRREEAE
jgi:gas vesicle structural protein